jgi:formylglycine-generating enzyme required for sulfatase activity
MPPRLVRLASAAAAAIVAASLLASATAGDAPRGPFKDCDVCPELVVVPAGSFVMGSPADEEGHSADEEPQHRVTIGRPFAAGKYEVTAAEWDACVAEAVCAGDQAANRASDRQPMTGVSWQDAQAYVRWLSRRTGKKYRLLTEAEWEYAARGGTTTPYHTGWTIGPNQANISGKATNPPTGFGVSVAVKQTVPVGSYPPNGFGLHDVHGNVWEWVEDCVNDGYPGAPTDGSAWMSGKCDRRVMRGGSWVDYPVGARSAIRSSLGSASRGTTLGFRVARTLD